MIKKKRALTATLVALGLIVASCGGDDAAPGEGTSVTMAKADWSTEDPNAYVAHLLLAELGYDVSDPKDLELGPANAYIAMAQGDADFWINSVILAGSTPPFTPSISASTNVMVWV